MCQGFAPGTQEVAVSLMGLGSYALLSHDRAYLYVQDRHPTPDEHEDEQ